ncbi:uncharacterized protein LDX57_009940 [Aspergillus melleus]|uniref:uncharacterized protein n=1 Tax=Aspergillus melleus TaxID=138277 RepID=UPI001E8E427C|nr:uncharacterized protein LDX57_009940 [Aspergillus melleus]KAH8432301.1 hypothetical protein LDX57_009940 [Aspergillus melleus]
MLRNSSMAILGPEYGRSFAKETWTLYAVGMLGVLLRFVARIRRLGITNLQTDDYLMVFAVVWYTILCVALNQVASGGGSNLMDEKDIQDLTPAIKAERERGSKWVYVSEHAFILAIWAMKACMLVIYARLTYGIPPQFPCYTKLTQPTAKACDNGNGSTTLPYTSR